MGLKGALCVGIGIGDVVQAEPEPKGDIHEGPLIIQGHGHHRGVVDGLYRHREGR